MKLVVLIQVNTDNSDSVNIQIQSEMAHNKYSIRITHSALNNAGSCVEESLPQWNLQRLAEFRPNETLSHMIFILRIS